MDGRLSDGPAVAVIERELGEVVRVIPRLERPPPNEPADVVPGIVAPFVRLVHRWYSSRWRRAPRPRGKSRRRSFSAGAAAWGGGRAGPCRRPRPPSRP